MSLLLSEKQIIQHRKIKEKAVLVAILIGKNCSFVVQKYTQLHRNIISKIKRFFKVTEIRVLSAFEKTSCLYQCN